MNNIQNILIFCFSMMIFLSCTKQFHSEQEMYEWINDPANGLVKERITGDIKIRAKYLPPEVLVYRELSRSSDYSQQEKDSLFSYYRHTRTFILEIGTVKMDEDIMFNKVHAVEEFKQRAEQLNFYIGEYLSLITEQKEYAPSLTNLENTYGMSTSRNIIAVFAPEKEKNELMEADKLTLKFDDEIFSTGMNHFVFNKKEINNIPEIKFWKL